MASQESVSFTYIDPFCCWGDPSKLAGPESPDLDPDRDHSPMKRKLRSFLHPSLGNSPSSSLTTQKLAVPANHLVLMVNGMIGSANDWKFTAKQFKSRFGSEILIHCSSCNAAILTFDGVDVMGHRLVEEVKGIVRVFPSLKYISIVAHSLGGLIARYAIGQLYRAPIGHLSSNGLDTEAPQEQGTVFGLQPINFITIATPHFGSRGNWQFPLLCGLSFLEKAAVVSAHWFVGRTGKHLFLTDGNEKQVPLLQRMATDCEEGLFISALKAFQHRVIYANANYDSIVGWRTATLRRVHEVPRLKMKPMDNKYPHVINVEDAPPEISGSERRTKDHVEEAIICGLRKLSWRRVDISFAGTLQKLAAHNTIQVKDNYLHSDGADVIAHMIDNFVL